MQVTLNFWGQQCKTFDIKCFPLHDMAARPSSWHDDDRILQRSCHNHNIVILIIHFGLICILRVQRHTLGFFLKNINTFLGLWAKKILLVLSKLHPVFWGTFWGIFFPNVNMLTPNWPFLERKDLYWGNDFPFVT